MLALGESAVCPVSTGKETSQKPRSGALSIRCEHVAIQPLPPSEQERHRQDSLQGTNQFSGHIVDPVYRGGLISYRITVGTYEMEVIDRSDRQFSVGENVMITLPPEQLWFMEDHTADGSAV
jgi:hypothetical protein